MTQQRELPVVVRAEKLLKRYAAIKTRAARTLPALRG